MPVMATSGHEKPRPPIPLMGALSFLALAANLAVTSFVVAT